MTESDHEPKDWFKEAARWYSENHQGCPWCLGANRVYKSKRGNVTEYRCGSCEFVAFHDKGTGRYFMGPGKEVPAPATMHATAALGSIVSIKK